MGRLEQVQRGMQRVAEERILAAMERGEFDHLPGQGQPLPGIDQPYNELWWVTAKLQREQLDGGRLGAELRQVLADRNAGKNS